MARRKPRPEEAPRELTRKEHRIRASQRERNRKLMLGTGIAVGLALLLVIAGLVSEFVIRPNSAVATVGETQLVTRDFWKRTFLEQNRLQNQLIQMSQLEQQFGGQGFFASQINQIQATLSSPFTLGVQVLDQMIREEVVRQKAAERGITVTDAEIDEALRKEVAAQQGAITVPQATATAESRAAATTTAESWTPTPTATVDANAVITATATPIPTPPPPPTSTILSDEQYTTGLQTLEKSLKDIADMTLAEYRPIVAARVLNEKLQEVIGEEQVAATSEQVHARHILLEVREPVTPTTEITSTTGLTATEGITEGVEATSTEEMTTTEDVSATEEVSVTGAMTGLVPVEAGTESTTGEITATGELTDTAAVTGTEAIIGTDALSETAEPQATPEPRDEAQTLSLALELRQRLLDGEDFATLATEYSDDPSVTTNQGDMGWFGRGAMVAPFEEAAFSLAVGEISEPIRSDFGYHIIEVLEKDAEHPKDQATLDQERATAYQTWLEEQIAATPVERPADLVSKLPRNLNPVIPQSIPAAATAAPLPPTQ
ncbi:MAG: peptidylprolyl isomerase [Caldilineaceae bacterium]|nr:peptidylprolyl isomerase [Caldilineaceae bacterium]